MKCGRPLAPVTHIAPVQPAKKGTSALAVVLAVIGIGAVGAFGLFAVMGIYGTRRFMASAKTAEAKISLGEIAKAAASAYEESATGDEPRRLCPSARAAVPADRSAVSGKKYQSASSEWKADDKPNTGFACLKFEMSAPQHFQYEYEATPLRFVARAHGDLNGDGKFSTFEIRGQIEAGRLRIDPVITETDPEE